MRILGIHDGHTSTACYLEDGRVLDAVSEERFTRKKGQGGFPAKAVEWIFASRGIGPDDIDRIALVGRVKPLVSIDQYAVGRQKYFPYILKLYPGDPRGLIRAYVAHKSKKRLDSPELRASLAASGLSIDKVEIVEHHLSHAATAYYLSPFHQAGQATLVVTLDGSGDGLCGSVRCVDADGNWEILREFSTFDSLGMVFSRATQYLAMRPWEHEYKLMGMAPYVSERYARAVRDIFGRYVRLTDDGLGLLNPSRLWGNSVLDRMRRDLIGHRFDAVSAGAQMLHEELVVELIGNWLRKTGLGRLAVAGGCFMNVKANKLLMELDKCDEMFVMPSGGDESCAIGSALWAAGRAEKEPIQPVDGIYWGPSFSNEQVERALEGFAGKVEFRRCEDIEAESARLLAEHKIIGRLRGRMEWGARALGARSIVANPSRPQNLRRLNAAIKMRDFWMPFAPSILYERRADYAVMPTDYVSYHMTMAYDSTPKAREDLIAALHPYDFTMRPQFVTRELNADYHKLLSEFERLTGIGGVLNTSFNLHGWPIVCSPEDALRTLMKSELDFVTLEDYLVWRT
jgi:carbamoyltransferase